MNEWPYKINGWLDRWVDGHELGLFTRSMQLQGRLKDAGAE